MTRNSLWNSSQVTLIATGWWCAKLDNQDCCVTKWGQSCIVQKLLIRLNYMRVLICVILWKNSYRCWNELTSVQLQVVNIWSDLVYITEFMGTNINSVYKMVAMRSCLQKHKEHLGNSRMGKGMFFPLWTFPLWHNSILLKGILSFFLHRRGNYA